MPATSATSSKAFSAFLEQPLTVLIRQTRQAVQAIYQSICPWMSMAEKHIIMILSRTILSIKTFSIIDTRQNRVIFFAIYSRFKQGLDLNPQTWVCESTILPWWYCRWLYNAWEWMKGYKLYIFLEYIYSFFLVSLAILLM